MQIIRKQQNGAILVVVLVMLLIMTGLGVASMRSSGLQEKMAGGARDQNMAFQAAEAALRVGEGFVSKEVAGKGLAAIDLFKSEESCPAISTSDWKPPAELERKPVQPVCTVQNYYGSGFSAIPREICIETGASSGPYGAHGCQHGSDMGFLFRVTAEGYGSTGTISRLRSTFLATVNPVDEFTAP